MSRSVEKSRS